MNGTIKTPNHVRVYPASIRLLFPLLHAVKGRMRNAVLNRVHASRCFPKIRRSD